MNLATVPRVRVDRLLQERVVAGQHLAGDLRVGALAEPGRAPEVGEETVTSCGPRWGADDGAKGR